MITFKYKEVLETVLLILVDRDTWIHTPVWKWFVLDRSI